MMIEVDIYRVEIQVKDEKTMEAEGATEADFVAFVIPAKSLDDAIHKARQWCAESDHLIRGKVIGAVLMDEYLLMPDSGEGEEDETESSPEGTKGGGTMGIAEPIRALPRGRN